MCDTNLKKNGSVLLYSKITGLDCHFMFDGSSMSIRYSKKTLLLCLLYQHQDNKLLLKIFRKYNNYVTINTVYRMTTQYLFAPAL